MMCELVNFEFSLIPIIPCECAVWRYGDYEEAGQSAYVLLTAVLPLLGW